MKCGMITHSAKERAVGVGVAGDREGGGGWTKFEKGGRVSNIGRSS